MEFAKFQLADLWKLEVKAEADAAASEDIAVSLI